MPSVVLLGDSVFDNTAYTNGAPDVASHLRAALGSDWTVTLCAIDGATTRDFGPQLDRIPDHATHLMVSLGGNDALEQADMLSLSVRSAGEALDRFAERIADFEQSYGWAIDAVVERGLPATVCTIYDASFEEPQARRIRTALMMFNDTIARVARRRDLPVLDLRLVCDTPEDFVQNIEPSATGGAKIAAALAQKLVR